MIYLLKNLVIRFLCKIKIHKIVYLKEDIFKEIPYCKWCNKIIKRKGGNIGNKRTIKYF